MLLQGKNAVVYGGTGAIGAAIARAFAAEGARVHLVARNRARLDQTAGSIAAAGGTVETASLDALDESAVERHAARIGGGIDVAVNAVGVPHVQGKPFAALSWEEYAHPIDAYVRTNFLTAKAVAPHMEKRGGGVILTLSTPGARLAGRGQLGNGVASAAVEAFSRILAAELGPKNIRVVCLRPHAIPEATGRSHTGDVLGRSAAKAGISVETLLDGLKSETLLGRLPTLEQVARTAAFVASDHAGAITGAVVNLTCGRLVD